MSNRTSRIETIERRFGLDTQPCGVCGHRAESVRCERPEVVADISRRFDEAMKEHMAMTDRMRTKLMELGEGWE